MINLAGRTALIAGASSGLGAGFARVLARAGGRVVLGARRIERVEALERELADAGAEALAVSLDVTEEASVIAAYDRAEARFGIVDTVVANAGIAAGGRSTAVPASDIRRVIDTNLVGAYLVAREGARRLIASGSRDREDGRIILIGSVTAGQVHTGDAAYAASKAGIAHLGRQFAREWIRQGINVNTIQPGWIHTEINDAWYRSDASRGAIAGLPRRRMQEADSLDAMLVYLASDCSKAVTGAVFTIDDGQSL
ncbi:3-oxoacyl-ACP reductase FabG [Sphingomonas oligophenolica]|uniref:SDR family NAD(P)-dependent oxidoreductase n=1 Tax=Sphingomonas oligophenolica TaxID=301154 RepID=A0ABU9Y8X3_9SPHN